MHRTPAKSETGKDGRISQGSPISPKEQREQPSALNVTKTLSVRRSVGEWESGRADNSQNIGRTQAPVSGSSTEVTIAPPPPKKVTSKSRADEARLCNNKAKMCLSSSRNLKTDLKHDITAAVERLYQLVKEAEAELTKAKGSGTGGAPVPQKSVQPTYSAEVNHMQRLDENILLKVEENNRMLKENERVMQEMRQEIREQRLSTEKTTYASMVTQGKMIDPKNRANERKTLHSVVVTSEDDQETGEEVLEKVRKAVQAKEGWITVEKVRKAKDRKIIMGCSTREDREKIKQKIEKAGQRLVVEDMRNKDPLLVLKDVLVMHSDADLIKALRNQNRDVFRGLDDEENRIALKYRKKTRNPHTGHIVVTVSPTIWGRATEQGRLRIDLQNVLVEDQSPLVQCSKCLGYGHGRRYCKEPADLCSHCGGPHLSVDCPDKALGEAPACINCKRIGSVNVNHNAFNRECPVRRKWDSIARASIQYC